MGRNKPSLIDLVYHMHPGIAALKRLLGQKTGSSLKVPPESRTAKCADVPDEPQEGSG